MGADPSAFANLYEFLAKNFDKQSDEVKADRKKIARFIYKMPDTPWGQGMSEFDFNDDDLDVYKELGVLGIARQCRICKDWFTEYSRDRHGSSVCDSL